MKLLNKQNFFLIPVYILIFTLVGFGFYYTAQYVLHKDVEEKLRHRKELVINNMGDIKSIMKHQKYSFNILKIEETSLPPFDSNIIKDTLIYDNIENKYELCSQLEFVARQGGQNYKITLKRSIAETSVWTINISEVVLVVFILLLVLLFSANILISKKIWKPFYLILDNILLFKISEPGMISFPSSAITEFDQLAGVLNKMMSKIKMDYVNLKKFSENASHEFQNPLLVAKIKLDMLLLSPNLSSEEAKSVNLALESVKKLSKLNESLLLLTKIENRQFNNKVNANLSQIVSDKLAIVSELIQLKNISFSVDNMEAFYVDIDPILADLLFENLLSNAIDHNIENGSISINCSKEGIEIKNTAGNLSVPINQLFERFSNSTRNTKSLELGLPIVKEICATSGIGISYMFRNGYHTLSLRHIEQTQETALTL